MSAPTGLPSQCVLYYNRGTSCYIRLLVSIFSLRKHYSGPVKLMQEGELDEAVAVMLGKLGVTVQFLPPSPDPVLVARSSLWRVMEEDHALMLDADTVVRGPVDEFFDWIKQRGFVASWFTGWLTTGAIMRRRIDEWAKVVPEMVAPAIAYRKAINGGVQGWSKGATMLPAYEALTRRGHAAGCNRIVLDEIALQLLLPHHRHHLAAPVWNTSGAFGDIRNARIVHYHGRKHCMDNPRCDLWKEHYFELLGAFPEHREALEQSWGDKRLGEFRKRLARARKNMTVVTAVNPAYAEKLKSNLRAWMSTPGLREQRFLVFVNGFRRRRDRAFLSEFPNVKVVRWSYPHPDAGTRELMLAAFLLGAAKHVKTPYWMKLDGDCAPKRGWWEWPDYENFTVVSHHWGYTRMKGERASKHWFNRLDEVFSPEHPLFQETFPADGQRISHRAGNPHGLSQRFASFCHIERTEFTRRMAEVLNTRNAGRMAIASQDTTSWYCTELWKEPVKLERMRRWFQP
jgi:hypothetical protein